MADDNKDKKGFSGLLDLASEVSSIDEPLKPEPKAEANPSTPKQPPHPKREAAPSEPERITTGSPHPIETENSGKSNGGSGGKWLLGISGIVFVIWLIDSGDQSSKRSSYNLPSSSQNYSYLQSSPAPEVQPPSTPQSNNSYPYNPLLSSQKNSYLQSSSAPEVQPPSTTHGTELQYTKPSVGTNNVLSVPEIRWCIRDGIRIEAMRDVINTDAGIDGFNKLVNDYNNRCGSYRYRQGSQSQAERDVEDYRSQIISEAVREASLLEHSSLPTYPSVSPRVSTSIPPKEPNAQYTREAQQLLTDLGYAPGPVDGDNGRRTADAVKAFQRDVGITQDGWIDENLLNALRSAKDAYKAPVNQPKPQSRASLQPRSSPHSATETNPKNLSYEEQFKYDVAQRLRGLGYDVDWRTNSLMHMIDIESRIDAANSLAQLGHKVDWRTNSLMHMVDIESRIRAANSLKQKGISVDWKKYSLMQLLNMEYGQN